MNSNGGFHDLEALEKKISFFSLPLSVDAEKAPGHLQLELIEEQCDTECHNRHQHLDLAAFYCQLIKDRFKHSDENAQLVWLDILAYEDILGYELPCEITPI